MELPDRALAGVDLVDGGVELGDELVRRRYSSSSFKSFPAVPLPAPTVRQQLVDLRQRLLGFVEQRGVLEDLAGTSLAGPANPPGWRRRAGRGERSSWYSVSS